MPLKWKQPIAAVTGTVATPPPPAPVPLPDGATGTFNPTQQPKGSWMNPGSMFDGRTTVYDPATGLPGAGSTAGDVNPLNPVVGKAPDLTPQPIDYDSLIANDPEYQLLLQQLQAAMGNMEADALDEQGTIRAQTQRRMQMLREQGKLQLKQSNNDFAGRGLGFSGGFLEDQGAIRRQQATAEADTQADETTRINDIVKQLTQARSKTDLDKRGAFLDVGRRIRGENGGALSRTPVDPYASRRITSTQQAVAPTVISPAAVARRTKRTVGGY